MKHKDSLGLLTYWDSLRGQRPAPSRSEIEPADIRNLLPSVFICEVTGEGRLVFRLAGTAICAMMGKELKSSPFSGLWFRDGQRNAERTALSVAARSMPAVLSLDGLSKGGRVMNAEMLLLPITGPTGQYDRLIGLLSVIEPPYWIGHDPVCGVSTTALRFLDMAQEPLYLANRPEVQFPAAHEKQKAPVAFGQRKAPHLVLLEGGRQD